MIFPLLLVSAMSAADQVYSTRKFICKNGMTLGLITHEAQPSITMMAHYCPFSLLESKSLGEAVRETCQNDKTDWAVKCFNDEFVPKCEDRNHKINLECFNRRKPE